MKTRKDDLARRFVMATAILDRGSVTPVSPTRLTMKFDPNRPTRLVMAERTVSEGPFGKPDKKRELI